MSIPETGHLLDRFPYVKLSSGSKTLAVFPGLDDAMFDGEYSVAVGWFLRWYFRRFLDDYAVYLVSRPRGIPADHSIADMADDYADAIRSALGPADVIGISMGGMIGLDLSVRHPELVDRLVLANSGCRIADPEPVRRFLTYAENRDWARIRAELAVAMFSDWRAVSYPVSALTVGRFFAPKPAVAADVPVSIEAILAFDATDRLDRVGAPTLVAGGSDDPYFPEPVLRETASGIPDGELFLIRGGKHAAFHEHKRAFDARTLAFLTGRERRT